MTSTTAPPSPAAGSASEPHAVVRFLGSLSGALDRVTEVPLWSMTPEEQRTVLVELDRQRRRLEELGLALLVQADRDGVGRDSGAASTPAWLAHATRTTTASRHRELHLARKLDETFHATKAALAAGLIDVEKASIVTVAVEALTAEYDDLPPGTPARAEAHMLDQAKEFDAPALKQLGKRLFEVVCPEAADEAEGAKLEKEEAKARALAHFSVRDHGDGTSTGSFKLPTLHADLLKKALQALTSPRRIGEARFDPATGKKLPHATLLGHGLIDLVENHLTDLPNVNGSPFTLVVTLGYDALMSGIGVAVTDTGHRISAGEARRLACKAGVIRPRLGRRCRGLGGSSWRGSGGGGVPSRVKRGVAAQPTRQAQRRGRRSRPTPAPSTGRAPERDLVVRATPPHGRPPRHLRHATPPQRQSPLHQTDVGVQDRDTRTPSRAG